MTLSEIIINCETYNEFSFVYAKKLNDRFYINSEAVVLELDESEMETNTSEIARQKCPGFDYFLEIFIIQDIYEDLKKMDDYKLDEKLIERIIYYAENDA
jgi:hypothetical protein